MFRGGLGTPIWSLQASESERITEELRNSTEINLNPSGSKNGAVPAVLVKLNGSGTGNSNGAALHNSSLNGSSSANGAATLDSSRPAASYVRNGNGASAVPAGCAVHLALQELTAI